MRGLNISVARLTAKAAFANGLIFPIHISTMALGTPVQEGSRTAPLKLDAENGTGRVQ